MLNAAGISFNDQWYSSQYLQFKIEMHFSSRYCYMLSSDQVYVTSQTKRYLTSIDRLCLHHALFRSHLAFLTLSVSLSQASSCECLFRWSETIKMRKYHCALLLLFSLDSLQTHLVTLFLSFWSASPSLLQPNTGVWRPKSETTKTVWGSTSN